MTQDRNLAIDNANKINRSTPLGAAALKMNQDKQAAGDGKKDFSSIIESL